MKQIKQNFFGRWESHFNIPPASGFEFIDGINFTSSDIWVKVFKNGPGKTCGRQSLKNFTWSILEYLDPHVTQSATLTLLSEMTKFSANTVFGWLILTHQVW